MNKEEARELLARRLAELRLIPFQGLLRYIGNPEVTEWVGQSGKRYQIETEAFWDDKRGEDLRVQVAIDDGGLGALKPMTDDFIKSADDRFVGE